MIQYNPEVVVQWNPKVYCNAKVMIRWLKQQYKYATHGFVTSGIPRLLSLDVFAGQKNEEVISIATFVSLSNYIIDQENIL